MESFGVTDAWFHTSSSIMLLAMAYDINKLHSKMQQNRSETQLFRKDSA